MQSAVEIVQIILVVFQDMLMLIKDDGLNVSSEEIVYDAVVSWVEHDREKRSQHVAQLMACIRFPLMRPPFLRLV